MDDIDYLPLASGEVFAFQDLPPGRLVFHAGHLRPSLTVSLPEGQRGILELGGDQSLNIWLDDYTEGAAWAIPEWRIDVDPKSLVEGTNASLMPGCAFRQDERVGLVGLFSGRFNMGSYFPVDATGDTKSLKLGTKAFFTRWRVIVMAPDGDVVVADDEGKARPRG